MAYIEINVDLDEFSSDELVSEIIERLKSKYLRKNLS